MESGYLLNTGLKVLHPYTVNMPRGEYCEMYRKLHMKVITLGDHAVGKSAIVPGIDLSTIGRCGMPVTATEVEVRVRDRRDGVVMAIWDTCGQ